jgi:hypothetical protein
VHAKKLAGLERGQMAAELALYSAILARVRLENDTTAIGELQSLLSDGFPRLPWSFDDVLLLVSERLSTEDHALYSALAAGILDANRMPDITALLLQRSTKAVPSPGGEKVARGPSPLRPVLAGPVEKPASAEPISREGVRP